MYWEYRLFRASGSDQYTSDILEALDQLGQLRWELVSVVFDPNNVVFTYFFKREYLEAIH